MVPISNNTAAGQLEGLLFTLDLLIADAEALDPTLVSKLGMTKEARLARLKIACNDKAATEGAYNNLLLDLQKSLNPGQRETLLFISTNCFLHHLHGTADAVRKSTRSLLKLLIKKNPRAFADANWRPDHEDETKTTKEIADWINQVLELFGSASYEDTAFDGIRIFIKLLCNKSDYGFNIADKLQTIAPELHATISELQRVVGTRATEYLRSSVRILRVKTGTLIFLEQRLPNIKMGISKALLNKLEKAVISFLNCDFAHLQLVGNASLSFSFCTAVFSFLKGLPLLCPLDDVPAKKKKEQPPVPTQREMVWFAKVQERLLKECEEDSLGIVSGMAGTRIVGRQTGWSRAEIVLVILNHCRDFLTPWDGERLTHALRVPQRQLACDGAATNFQFLQQDRRIVEFWRMRARAMLPIAKRRSRYYWNRIRRSVVTKSKLVVWQRPKQVPRVSRSQSGLACLLWLVLGGMLTCFSGRAAEFLEGGSLEKPTPEQIDLLRMVQCHNDFMERSFAVMDARSKRSKSATIWTKSRFTMTRINDTSSYLRALSREQREEFVVRARKFLRKHQKLQRKYMNEVQTKKKAYLLQMEEVGIIAERNRKAKLLKQLNVPLVVSSEEAELKLKGLSPTAQTTWLKKQLNGWKARCAELSKTLLRWGCFKRNGSVEGLTVLLGQVLVECVGNAPKPEEKKAEAKSGAIEAAAVIEDVIEDEAEDVELFWIRCERKAGEGKCDKWRALETKFCDKKGKFMCKALGLSCREACDHCELQRCVCPADAPLLESVIEAPKEPDAELTVRRSARQKKKNQEAKN